MPEQLLHSDERIQKAVDFCWETQRLLSRARHDNWHHSRLSMYVKSRVQQWRRFPSGVRTSAHLIFMEQLHEQLRKPEPERDTTKPVWLNETSGIGLPQDFSGEHSSESVAGAILNVQSAGNVPAPATL